MTQRYFRSGEATYEGIRQTLDNAWGLPNDRGTVTCVQPSSTAPRDSEGRVVLAVHSSFTEFTVAAEMLPQLLASGAVTEITEDEYRAALPQMP